MQNPGVTREMRVSWKVCWPGPGEGEGSWKGGRWVGWGVWRGNVRGSELGYRGRVEGECVCGDGGTRR